MPHDPTSHQLSLKQRKAVEALLTTGEVKAAAAAVGIHRDTLHRWLKETSFQAAVREAEAAALDDLSRVLVGLGRTAVTTLNEAMSEPGTPAATKVRAADVTLSRLLQLRELAQLEARMQALEAAVSQEPGRR
jgi:thiamine phosphate synthase YjbQ (UPF0047 family)